MSIDKLRTRVQGNPHWRVVFKPHITKPNLLERLKDCWDVAEGSRVLMRGWDYPAIPRVKENRYNGNDWVGAGVEFGGHREVWKLFQSGMFVHLFTPWEAARDDFAKTLMDNAQRNLKHIDIDWKNIRGCLSIVNVMYTMVEISEFTARLAQRLLPESGADISIRLAGFNNFLLMTTSPSRLFYNKYLASEPLYEETWNHTSSEMVTNRADLALKKTMWLFERFGWIDLPEDDLKRDIDAILSGALVD